MTDLLPGLIKAREIVAAWRLPTDAFINEIDAAIEAARKSGVGREYRNPRNVALDQGYGGAQALRDRPADGVEGRDQEIDRLKQVARTASLSEMTTLDQIGEMAMRNCELRECIQRATLALGSLGGWTDQAAMIADFEERLAALRVRPTGTFADGVEAAAKVAEEWADSSVPQRIRALIPSPPPEVRGDEVSAAARDYARGEK
jgi:hypothetical protein